MMAQIWFFDIVGEKLNVTVDGDDRGQVQAVNIGKKLTFVEILLITSVKLFLSTEHFDDTGSDVCKRLTPLKKSRTQFVARWSKYVSEDHGSCDSETSTEFHTESDESAPECTNGSQKKAENNVAGIQDKILRERFLGTYDVHINNLTAPHPSRITRVLHHDHVGTLMDSFQENDCGQLVILVGMLTSEGVSVATLKDEGSATIEVLGGNHTREALQSLYVKGVLTFKMVKVNLYNPLTTTAALAIGYQHNVILHLTKRPLCFVDKVRLMRDCRPAVDMNKYELAEWKDMLLVIFRVKNRRILTAGFQQHIHMARVSDAIWAKVVRATKTIVVTEKFFRPLVRIDGVEKVEDCLDTLIDEGLNAYKKKVQYFTDQGYVRSQKSTLNKISVENADEDERVVSYEADGSDIVPEQELAYKSLYLQLKDEYESLEEKYNQTAVELKKDKEESKEVRGTKRANVSEHCDDLSIGESVEALWRDEDGIDQWLPAKVLRSDMRVQYECDSGKANIPFSWIRRVEQKLVN